MREEGDEVTELEERRRGQEYKGRTIKEDEVVGMMGNGGREREGSSSFSPLAFRP